MDDLVCREYRPDEAAEACAFTAQIFGPMPLETWVREPNLTASMAYLGEELVGVIPLSLRRFQLAPGITAETAWEHAVGTREDLRSRGIGTRMILAAREFLADRCDLLCVYRGGERSPGYRFYADKTDHVDLAYVPFDRLAEPVGERCDGFATHPHQDVVSRAAELAALHRSQWGGYGGYVVRDEGCYPWLIDHAIYGRIPAVRRLHLLSEAGALVGFAITAIREGSRADGTCLILDFAVADGEPTRIERLLRGLEAYGAEQSTPLVWPTGMRLPHLPILLAHGFERGPRRMMLMAWPLRPERLLAKLVARRGGCEVTIDAWTPSRDMRLWDAGPGAAKVTVEMKDRELCLLLTSRLDGRSALEEERLTVYGEALAKAETTLARLGRQVRWVHPYLDWL